MVANIWRRLSGAGSGRTLQIQAMTTLRRSLSSLEYFTFAFGSMVGVGWLVLMDNWLGRGGPGGAMLGFLIGGVLLLPIAHLWTVGARPPRRRGRGGVRRSGVSSLRGLRDRVGHGARLRHRVPVGGGGDRQPAGACISRHQHGRALQRGGQDDLRSPARRRSGPDRVDRRRQLSRHPFERALAGCHDHRTAGVFPGVRGTGSRTEIPPGSPRHSRERGSAERSSRSCWWRRSFPTS